MSNVNKYIMFHVQCICLLLVAGKVMANALATTRAILPFQAFQRNSSMLAGGKRRGNVPIA